MAVAAAVPGSVAVDARPEAEAVASVVQVGLPGRGGGWRRRAGAAGGGRGLEREDQPITWTLGEMKT